MQKVLLSTFALVAMHASAVFGQTFTGTWQGTLNEPAGDMRVVIKISITGADKLAAEFFSTDRGAPPVSADSVAASGSNLKMNVARLSGTFEGKLSADGKTMAGTWNHGMPEPLILTRATPETAWTIPEPPSQPKMMDPNAKPEFEVATIKLSDPNRGAWALGVNRSGMLNTSNTTLSDLIRFAYDFHPDQIIGAPAWVASERFDISARPDTAGIPSLKQQQKMLSKLLADRFSLVFHNEKRELAVYAITVAKGGEKIRKEDNANIPAAGFGGQPQRGFNVRNATMAEFASVMQAQFMDEPVVDETGLGDRRYTFTLKFTPGSPEPAQQATDPDAPPDVYSAIEQLGLRLKKTKALVDVMIIDKIEKPSAN